MTQHPDFQGLFCELSLPLVWAACAEADSLSVSPEQTNQNCLKTILGLDEISQDVTDDSPEIGQEIQRLDFKINIILELVAQLASQNSQLPETVEIKLGSNMLQWTTSGETPEQNQVIQVKIFPDSRYPFPLVLSGKVASVRSSSNQNHIVLELNPIDTNTQELLEKYIFRCHRRQIAKLKSLKTS